MRSYRDISGEALADPNRHTCAPVLRWTGDGLPIFGEPADDGQTGATEPAPPNQRLFP